MTVHRFTILPTAPNRGRLIVPSDVAAITNRLLQECRGPDGPHEGLVYWAGRRCGEDTIVLAAVAPESDHGPQHVFVDAGEVGRMARRTRSVGLVITAQVHSHPGGDTRHSDGDDKLILMPSEGMFSLVIAHYGFGSIQPSEGAGLHQYQDGRWVQVQAGSTEVLIIVPPLLGAKS
jgi:proteasome lid subunit RPN8/RPN11